MIDPRDRPPQQLEPMVAALARHQVEWVLIGSQVLALYGADLVPNDLDVLPELSPTNLQRLAECLNELGAVAAYLDGWGGVRGTLDACQDWTPEPATKENLDWLMVTPLGMLDVVIAFATEPYEQALRTSHQMMIGTTSVAVCDPRRVLVSLEKRSRTKDQTRVEAYRTMRARFGMPPQ